MLQLERLPLDELPLDDAGIVRKSTEISPRSLPAGRAVVVGQRIRISALFRFLGQTDRFVGDLLAEAHFLPLRTQMGRWIPTDCGPSRLTISSAVTSGLGRLRRNESLFLKLRQLRAYSASGTCGFAICFASKVHWCQPLLLNFVQ